MIGGGVPKNFAQDTVVCAELLGHDAAMHKYAVQITVAEVETGPVRDDPACVVSQAVKAKEEAKTPDKKSVLVKAIRAFIKNP